MGATSSVVEASAVSLADQLSMARADLEKAERRLSETTTELERLRAEQPEATGALLRRAEEGDSLAGAELKALNTKIAEKESELPGRRFNIFTVQVKIADLEKRIAEARSDEFNSLLAGLRSQRDAAVMECVKHFRVAGALLGKAGAAQDEIERALSGADSAPDNGWRDVGRLLSAVVRVECDCARGRYMVDLLRASRYSPNDCQRIINDSPLSRPAGPTG